ncbi:MAG: DUF72 domain-containing protein [Candidatus Dormibacteraeota bacterium]|nr:DUF72 domain-containing protein [Candidatus Dormibacteraeota bacterium]
MLVRIGTSGWQYRDWRGPFYPEKLAQRAWLEHYAERFAVVEVNNTFYNLPTEDAVRRWHDTAPRDFEYVLKASRYLSHVRRLREPTDPVRTMMERFRPLGRSFTTMLLQLPPRFHADVGRLDAALAAFPRRIRVAVEFRDATWFSDEVRAVLRARNAALCVTDRLDASPEPDWPDLSWMYVRFHQGTASPAPCYRRAALRSWAARLAQRRDAVSDVYAFFNNDTRCCAPRDAAVFAEECAAAGLEVTRTPQPEEIRPG